MVLWRCGLQLFTSRLGLISYNTKIVSSVVGVIFGKLLFDGQVRWSMDTKSMYRECVCKLRVAKITYFENERARPFIV